MSSSNNTILGPQLPQFESDFQGCWIPSGLIGWNWNSGHSAKGGNEAQSISDWAAKKMRHTELEDTSENAELQI